MEMARQLSCQLGELLKRRESRRELTFADNVNQFDASESGRC